MESLYWPYICILSAVLMMIFLMMNLKKSIDELMERVKILENFNEAQAIYNNANAELSESLNIDFENLKKMNLQVLEHAEKVINNYENLITTKTYPQHNTSFQ